MSDDTPPNNSKSGNRCEKSDFGKLQRSSTKSNELLDPLDSDNRDLLLKELDDRHRYSRFIAQAYLAWYTFFVTLNLTIMVLSLANATKIEPHEAAMSKSFLVFNFLGILTTLAILRGTTNQQTRIYDILKVLIKGSNKRIDVKPLCTCCLCRIIKVGVTPIKSIGRVCQVIRIVLKGRRAWIVRKHKRNLQTRVNVDLLRSPYPNHLFILLPIAFALSHFVLIGFWIVFLIDGF